MADDREGPGMIFVTGLWKSTTQSGAQMLSGHIGGVKIIILPNKKKTEGDKLPNANLFFAQKERGGGGQSGNDDGLI